MRSLRALVALALLIPPFMPPLLFTIFGATGDLNRRKLLPALYEVTQQDGSPEFAVLGTSRSQLSDADFDALVRESLVEFAGVSRAEADAWLRGRLHFQSLTVPEGDDPYAALVARVGALDAEHGLGGNAVYYLSLPPQVFPKVIKGLGLNGANDGDGYTRLVVEKPFGHDLASARALNRAVHDYFDEEQVYRIDHYLGKETVQNLLAFRFANSLFEPLWNRDRIERIEITVAESLGVEDRAGYYDESGALRDMIQNHLTQLLTVVAMDVPTSFEAEAIRAEKLKVLKTVRPVDDADLIYAQYTRGEGEHADKPGYLDEDGVAPDSHTPTYVAMRLHVDNWRWQGVPFLLRTGKRFPQKLTEIAIIFRCAPVSLFVGGADGDPATGRGGVQQDILRIQIAPDQGVEMDFNIKRPGPGMVLQRQRLSFDYDEVFGELPDAYTALLADVMEGDRTLFVGADEVEASWTLYDPILQRRPKMYHYPAGSWGPKEARKFVEDWETGGE